MIFLIAAEITPECVSNSECAGNYACVNNACINPCNCGPNAKCNVVNHYPSCVCPPGYSGNPQLGCFKRKLHLFYSLGIASEVVNINSIYHKNSSIFNVSLIVIVYFSRLRI